MGEAFAVGHAGEIGRWRRPERSLGRVGLIGWNTATGLGYQNRGIAVNLPVARWLAPPHPRFGSLPPPYMSGEFKAPWSRGISRRALRRWLSGLDWVLFVENPYISGVVHEAREMGISVACVPNWEWLTAGLDWLPYVDLMICPTQYTYRMVLEWRRELKFSWTVVSIPWPIDPTEFNFRPRDACSKFLFVNGTGGGRAGRLDGSVTSYHRKGIELIAATARLMKSVPFLVYSQCRDLPALPANVQLRRSPRNNRELYSDGDVCVQPSHWEGLGLQHLECQAAGLPLVTTDAPPMNECRPFRAVPADLTELVFVCGDHPVDSHIVEPEVLAQVLGEVYGTDVREASQQARAFIIQERSWPRVRAALAGCLTR